MMDISSMLQYYNNMGVTGTVASQKATTASANTSETEDVAVSFSNILNEEVSELQETQNLAAALDGTVLSGLGNLSDLSTEMLRSTGGQKMLQELMEGQFASVVTSSSEDDESDGQTVSEAVLGSQSSAQTRYEQIVANLEDAMATLKTADGGEE